MHNLETIAGAIATTVRFKQNQNSELPVYDDDIVGPSEARLVDHPLLTGEIINAIQPDFNNIDPPTYDVAREYNVDDVVLFNTEVYQSLEDNNTGNDPDVSPTQWRATNQASIWLRDIRKECARTVWADVQRMKKNDQITKEMLDNMVLYSGVGRFDDQITKRGRLVGFEIKLLNSNNIKVILERIMTQFSAVESFNLYLYYSEDPTAIATIPVNHATANRAQWEVINRAFLYRDFESDIAGGAFYLMYDEDDLTGRAINMRINNKPCASCNRTYYTRWEKWSQYVSLEPISIAQGNKPGDPMQMFDVTKIAYEPSTNFGLNFAVSSYCDLTNYAVDHKEIFADALKMQCEMRLVKEILNSTQSNIISEKTKDNARFVLQNAEIGGENLVKDVEKAKKALGFELSDIQNSVCMPKIASKGVRYGSVGNGRKNRVGYHGYYQR